MYICDLIAIISLAELETDLETYIETTRRLP